MALVNRLTPTRPEAIRGLELLPAARVPDVSIGSYTLISQEKQLARFVRFAYRADFEITRAAD